MLLAVERHARIAGAHVYNLGLRETVTVDESVGIITEWLGVTPAIEHTGGPRGWIGDSPLIDLDTTKIRSLGWEPTLTIREAITRTLDWLDQTDRAAKPAARRRANV
jgi:UDP-glucose 4-epimerase